MMASRKLKFKAKPIPGNSVRRLPHKGSDVSADPATPLSGNESISSSGTNDNERENSPSVLTKTTVHAQDKKLHSDEIITGENVNENISQKSVECTVKCSGSSSNSGIESDTLSDPTEGGNMQELNDSNCNHSTIEGNKLQNSSFNDKEEVTGPKSTVPIKSAAVKSLPRFGRSRCKPVFTSAARRSAPRVSNDSQNTENSQLSDGTESVVKAVESETCSTQEQKTTDVNRVSIVPEEIPICEDISNNHVVQRTTVTSSNLIETNDLTGDTLTIPAAESHDRTDISDLNTSQKMPSKEGSEQSEAASNKTGNKIDIVNQPIEVNVNPSESAKEAEVLHGSKSTLTPKVPLSPLRATSKIFAPKPTPLLRDGIRRISFQGSDSEEDLKKKKDSIITIKDKKSDLKSGKRKKSQGSTYTKMGLETLEKFHQKFGKGEKPDKSKLTMIDLIFYNPKDNPMSNSTPKSKKKIAAKKEIKTDISEEVSETLAEQSVDDVEPAQAMPVPQLTIGPDGQIILDPKSLVIETTGTQKSREELEKSQVVQDSGITRYSTYSKRKPRRSVWSSVETLQFYKALSTIGPDFTLMTQLFPNRDRHDLKLKFKKEDKLNRELIDKAMAGQGDFDFDRLKDELQQENDEIKRKKIESELYLKQKEEERLKAIEERKQLQAKKREFNVANKNKIRKTAISHEIDDTDDNISDEEAKKCHRAAKEKRLKSRRPELKKLRQSVAKKRKKEKEELKEEEFAVRKCERKSRRLNEYHEMNETLKKDLCSEPEETKAMTKAIPDPESDDWYTPNGLFHTPPETVEDRHEVWTIDVSNLPPIEETVLGNGGNDNDTEPVSEISGLGSFGQDSDTALDLSLTDSNRALDLSVTQPAYRAPYLDRRIISESMQIVGQLTSNVEAKDPLEFEKEKILPLPSFETVIGMRSPFRHLVEAAEYIESNCAQESSVEIRTNQYCPVVTDIGEQSAAIFNNCENSGVILERTETSEVIHERSEQSETILEDCQNSEVIRERTKVIPDRSEESQTIVAECQYIKSILERTETSEVITETSESGKQSETILEDCQNIKVIYERSKTSEAIHESSEQSETILEDCQNSEVILERTEVIPDRSKESETILADSQNSDATIERTETSEVIHESSEQRETILGGCQNSELILERTETCEVIHESSKQSETILEDCQNSEATHESSEQSEMILGD